MMILSDNEVNQVAWRLVLAGARSMAEDWIDEEGEFTEEDSDRVFHRQQEIIEELQTTVGILLDG